MLHKKKSVSFRLKLKKKLSTVQRMETLKEPRKILFVFCFYLTFLEVLGM